MDRSVRPSSIEQLRHEDLGPPKACRLSSDTVLSDELEHNDGGVREAREDYRGRAPDRDGQEEQRGDEEGPGGALAAAGQEQE